MQILNDPWPWFGTMHGRPLGAVDLIQRGTLTREQAAALWYAIDRGASTRTTKDDLFFAHRGYRDARDFYARYVRLAGIFVVDEATTPPQSVFSANRECRHPLPTEALARLGACLFVRVGRA